MGSDHMSDAATPSDEITALRLERDQLYDRLLRAGAEFDNYRKRTDRERRELSEAAAVDLIRDLLPVVDDLDRALAAPGWGGGDDGARRGIELIQRQILDLLRARGVEPFDAIGHDFDPAWHEAVAGEPAEGRRDGEVTGEVRRGFRIGQRLLRPAMVRVART
jgi:molecular chaperone GrpE